MPNYKRLYAKGSTYFFTVALADRRSSLLTDHAPALFEAWRDAVRAAPFRTDAYVILPDHLHCIWTLPPGDDDFSRRWRILKARFSRRIDRVLDPASGRRPGERGVWQRRFWEHLIRDDEDWGAHVAYIHANPVKHGHAARREDWPLSSWRRFRSEATWPDDRTFGEPSDP